MADQDKTEILKQTLAEKVVPISQELVKLAKEFKVDLFLLVSAPQLGVSHQLSQIQRLSTVDRLETELQALRSDTSVWLNAGLTAEDEAAE